MSDGVVAVAGGRVRGVERDGVWTFAGIPFAASPAGAGRWRPPAAPEPWSGVRDATEFGPMAPQAASVGGLEMPGEPDERSEDCLSLNLWTPGLDGERRPVMVFVHGGGFTTGCGSGLLYRGGELVRRGDVVVVTLNYRLGALGFLGHPALDDGAGGFGNWGLRDQVAALRWVQSSIAEFGGDPDQVTVFGESAGGMSISALLAVPEARGLFRRAIIQSGPTYVHSEARGVTQAEALVDVLGLPEVRRDLLERVPAAELVEAASTLQNRTPEPGEIPLPFQPIIDGVFLPRNPYDAFLAGDAADIPLLIGTTKDEFSFFGLGDPSLASLDDARLLRWIEHAVPGVDPGEVVANYRDIRRARGEAAEARDLWVAIGTDRMFRWPSLHIATAQCRHQPDTYVYLFTWETPVLGGVLGSCHALELPFVFGAVRFPEISMFSGSGPEAEALSGQMMDAWLSFARSGHPGHPGIGAWPAWDPDRRPTMVFGPASGVQDAPRDEELVVWEKSHPLPA